MNGNVIRFDRAKVAAQLEFMCSHTGRNFFEFFILKQELLGTI